MVATGAAGVGLFYQVNQLRVFSYAREDILAAIHTSIAAYIVAIMSGCILMAVSSTRKNGSKV
jgi:hypothetical protein